ncbi:MAG: acyl-CoA carboxylase biotin carboxyl carrier protein subunit [Planctomycetota bacterium]
MRYFARIGEREYECRLEAHDDELFVEVGGTRYCADLRHIPRSHAYSLLLDGRSYEFTLHETEEAIELSGGAGLFQVQVEDARTHAARAKTVHARAPGAVRSLKAVMPGIVREVRVAPGDVAAKGDPLLILEAMKMQNEIRADHPGTVTAVHVAAGDTVEKGAKLVDLE